ncbi:MAG: signal peptidase II [Phycisphaerae bacterium]
MRSWQAHLRLWLVAIVALWIDLASKSWAFAPGNVRGQAIIPGILDAQRSLNSGALFGSFSGWVPAFIVASVLALLFVLYVFASSHRNQWFMHLGLAFILAGALGNLYDRAFVQTDIITTKPTADHAPGRLIGLMTSGPDADPVVLGDYPDRQHPRKVPRSDIESIDHHGVVRDFLKLTPIAGFDYWPWVFNVADALLVLGVGIMLPVLWRERHAHQAASPRPAPAK